ncbi:MAG: hypothetical protein ABIC95_00210 [archaeon]
MLDYLGKIIERMSLYLRKKNSDNYFTLVKKAIKYNTAFNKRLLNLETHFHLQYLPQHDDAYKTRIGDIGAFRDALTDINDELNKLVAVESGGITDMNFRELLVMNGKVSKAYLDIDMVLFKQRNNLKTIIKELDESIKHLVARLDVIRKDEEQIVTLKNDINQYLHD